ncbi:MAG: dihydrofolate reductase [Myxococcaceae bacterium]|nr:dihydrofolate reductase [Myxococcaceae bacterium]
MTRPLALIVALSKNRGIGLHGKLPWHVPEDLKRFKALTMGHAILMGRKTHESIGRALPGRRNVVLTRAPATFAGCETAPSLDAALALVADDALPFIIGGARLYTDALPRVTHLYLTQLGRHAEADTFFPELNASEWREVRRERGATADVEFIDLVRAQ